MKDPKDSLEPLIPLGQLKKVVKDIIAVPKEKIEEAKKPRRKRTEKNAAKKR